MNLQNVNAINCPNYTAVNEQTALNNVKKFYLILAGVIAILLFLFLFGSCLGCEACFACAEACDSSCDCGMEECGRECDEESDDCVACDGIVCGNREGCFSCSEKYDCSTCGGVIFYGIELRLNDVESRSIRLHEGDTSIEVMYPNSMDSTYFDFLGYFDKRGRLYVDSEGNFVKSIKHGLTLYAKYEEKCLGDEFTIYFDYQVSQETPQNQRPNLSSPPSRMVVEVGGGLSLPDHDYPEGFKFLGWFTQDGRLISNDEKPYEEFHLYDFGITPGTSNKVIRLYGRYALEEYEITYYYTDNSCDRVTVKHGAYFYDVENLLQSATDRNGYQFICWSSTPNENDRVDSQLKITEDITIFGIFKKIIKINFHSNNGITYVSEYLIGDEVDLLNDINALKIIEDPSVNPGYKFNGWYLVQYPTSWEQPETYIEELYDMNYDFYAQWSIATYTISYKVYDSANGRWRDVATNSNCEYQYGVGMALYNSMEYYEEINGAEFIGWCLNEDLSDTPITSLNDGHRYYGNITLYAKFANN